MATNQANGRARFLRAQAACGSKCDQLSTEATPAASVHQGPRGAASVPGLSQRHFLCTAVRMVMPPLPGRLERWPGDSMRPCGLASFWAPSQQPGVGGWGRPSFTRFFPSTAKRTTRHHRVPPWARGRARGEGTAMSHGPPTRARGIQSHPRRLRVPAPRAATKHGHHTPDSPSRGWGATTLGRLPQASPMARLLTRLLRLRQCSGTHIPPHALRQL